MLKIPLFISILKILIWRRKKMFDLIKLWGQVLCFCSTLVEDKWSSNLVCQKRQNHWEIHWYKNFLSFCNNLQCQNMRLFPSCNSKNQEPSSESMEMKLSSPLGNYGRPMTNRHINRLTTDRASQVRFSSINENRGMNKHSKKARLKYKQHFLHFFPH